MFKKMKINMRVMLGFILLITISVVSYWLIWMNMSESLEEGIEHDLATSKNSSLYLIKSAFNSSVQNYLRAVAEKNKNVLQSYYEDYKKGLLPEALAKKKAFDVMRTNVIGKTGYIYCINSNGDFVHHPVPTTVGKNASKHEFINEQIAKKEGVVYYKWKNPGEEEERQKLVYTSYFEPWDVHIGASSYLEELETLFDINTIVNELKSYKIGETGYVYILNADGNFVFHPDEALMGKNVIDLQDLDGNLFIQKILKEKNGRFDYRWLDKKTNIEQDKIADYVHFPELNWIMVAGAVKEEVYADLDLLFTEIIWTVIILVSVSIIIIVLFTLNLNKILGNMLNETKHISDSIINGKLDIRGSTDNINTEFQPMINGMNEILDNMIKPLNVTAEYVDRISKGDIPPKIEDDYRGDFNEIKNNLNQLIDVMQGLLDDTGDLIDAAVNGKLDKRADSNRYVGGWQELVVGINKLIDAFVKPINVTAEYVDRISKGDIPPKIDDEYKGDFNEIKNNLNQCIDTLNGLIDDMKHMSNQHDLGEIDVQMNVNNFHGAYKQMAKGVNTMVNGHISVKKKAMACFQKFGAGNFDAVIEQFPGKKKFINDTIEEVRGNLKGFIEEMMNMSKEHDLGDIDIVINEDRFEGAWKEMAVGVNGMVNGHISVKKKAMACFQEFGAGNFDAEIEQFPGKKKFINDTIEEVRSNLANFKDQVGQLIGDAKNGKLSSRADSSGFQGGWAELTQGVNQLVDAFVKPINVTSEYIARISKGDIPNKLEEEYKGDFNNIKNSLNLCIDSINKLDTNLNEIVAMQKEGDIEFRTNPTVLQGAYSDLLSGINVLCDSIINPVVEGLGILSEYADGNFDKTMRDLPGKQMVMTNSYNQIKSNLLALIQDINILSQSAAEGNLNNRAEIDKHKGEYQNIIIGINSLVDAISKPLNEAGEVLANMSSGNLTTRMMGSYKGDFSTLKSNINLLADSLNTLLTQVGDTVQNTSAAAVEISSTADTMAAASAEQSAQADEVASAVEEMSRTITQNAMSATQTAQTAQQNGDIAEEGGEVVKQTVAKMRDIADVVSSTAKNIEKLGESSKEIGEIISVIDDIADQTNLLALNAAIEAARAGEQGRGFAVVADEVRKLAERTTDATQQIATMIKGIQSETEEAVVEMQRGNEEVSNGIELADKAGNSLEQVVTSSQELLDMINQIAAASEEQSSTSEEIAKNVASISEVTSDSARRVQDIAQSSENLAQLTEHLNALMSQFTITKDATNIEDGKDEMSLGYDNQEYLPENVD